MRIIMVMAKGILIRLRYGLQVLPVYTTLIWFVKPSSSAGKCFIHTLQYGLLILKKQKKKNYAHCQNDLKTLKK